jgi:hypothetical protein
MEEEAPQMILFAFFAFSTTALIQRKGINNSTQPLEMSSLLLKTCGFFFTSFIIRNQLHFVHYNYSWTYKWSCQNIFDAD